MVQFLENSKHDAKNSYSYSKFQYNDDHLSLSFKYKLKESKISNSMAMSFFSFLPGQFSD